MTLAIKSMIISLVILATASNIHTQQIQKAGSLDKLVVLKSKKTIVLGSGVVPDQLPIIAYSSKSNSLDVSAYIFKPKKQCDFTISGEISSSVDVQTITQLPNNKIIFVWYVQSDVELTISILDMNACINKNNLKLTTSSVVVPFVDGFDVITWGKSRTSYDTDGNQIGKTKSFPIYSDYFNVSAVSETSRTDGFFIADYKNAVLNLVNVDGASGKHLLNLPNLQVYSSNEQSMYSVCWIDVSFVASCFQYDQSGNEKWNNKAKLTFDGVMQVKNLAAGGLVFAALNSEANQLCIVEMGPKQFKIWSYSGKQTFKGARFLNFNKNDHTIILAYETSQVKQGVPEESVVSQKYSLQN